MNRTSKVLSLIAALVFAFLVAAQSVAAKGAYDYSFDKTVAPFGSGTDSAFRDARLELRAEEIGVTDPIMNSFANLKATLSSAGTGAWAAALFDAYGEDIVNVSFSAKNTGNCDACKLVAYVGSQKPLKAAQFTEIASVNDQALSGYWQTYKLRTIVKADGMICIAVGFSGGKDMAKATGSVGFDNVQVSLMPVP